MSKQKQKIGKLSNVKRQAPVIVFGTQRIGAIYALRAGIDPNRIRLATHGADHLRGLSSGTITVVRVPKEYWTPSTFPCEKRVAETEQALKAFGQAGGTIEDVWMD